MQENFSTDFKCVSFEYYPQIFPSFFFYASNYYWVNREKSYSWDCDVFYMIIITDQQIPCAWVHDLTGYIIVRQYYSGGFYVI